LPQKRHSAIKGQRGPNKRSAKTCLCFLNFLAFLRPAADRTISVFS
jgi:hypothetical protein